MHRMKQPPCIFSSRPSLKAVGRTQWRCGSSISFGRDLPMPFLFYSLIYQLFGYLMRSCATYYVNTIARIALSPSTELRPFASGPVFFTVEARTVNVAVDARIWNYPHLILHPLDISIHGSGKRMKTILPTSVTRRVKALRA